MKELKIPEATVSRLSVYSRYLTGVEEQGIVNISSGEIAEGVGGTPAQVRKDLAYFGEFGTRGVGYNVKQLNQEIMGILGLKKGWNMILIGAGNLGSALSQYRGFQTRGFNIVAVFDNDMNKVGLKLNGLPIYAVNQMAEFIDNNDISIGIITVPSEYAQDIADILVETKNIKGILNFAPVVLTIPEEIEVRNVDLSVNLEVLSYNIEKK
ncbi:MAG: redox-sensing transcriptional repressor Rex [Peptococcaceae bacterium]|nr:redox-sensing transcriptional repressor Rex [Peptococcaceae bacterium]MBQ2034455.1 redox-sensing transcriptional repressor Rex [Peptococcaceae bacterium]MBQ5682525.1 redox-sensing transcriptional repressor Rex [Peptococcaceae bacterium]MBQ5703114.1 redox-sensing transcriptional repressor Rex [Peptococcaceae bacterium]MBQ5858517.1 redox-sensing transcriptional repressor Rex [Peptococcaceae bacterium]